MNLPEKLVKKIKKGSEKNNNLELNNRKEFSVFSITSFGDNFAIGFMGIPML